MGPRDWMETIKEAVERIGTTKDTGGSTTAGTLMGKLNAALSKINTIYTATGKIGSTGDTGGSQTAGTVMGKENAILKMLKEYDSKVKGNMILKQTPNKTLQVPSTGMLDIDFDFGKPVRIVGVYFSLTKQSSSSSLSFPAYIINGEDSFTTNFLIPSSGSGGTGVFMRDNSGGVGFFVASDGAFKLIPDIWATKLKFQIRNGVTVGSTAHTYVVYQEEG